ncbi:MAG: hypothetical protein CL862_06730 [Cyanobium sp. NAT70]|nr:hypothetical protein [Cyanobium sp. NAT70]
MVHNRPFLIRPQKVLSLFAEIAFERFTTEPMVFLTVDSWQTINRSLNFCQNRILNPIACASQFSP